VCVIAVCKNRKLTPTELIYCWINNPDGAGVAWGVGKDCHTYQKGIMDFDQFETWYKNFNILPHIVHFRIASSGAIVPHLTHPFICKEDSPLPLEWAGVESLLFHNGVVSGWERLAAIFKIGPPVLTSYWNDSRVLSCLLSKVRDHSILTYESKSSKFATFLNGDIKTYGIFDSVDGILFSNDSHKEILYEFYTVVEASGHRKQKRRKKRRNICYNGNEQQSTSSCEIPTGHNRNYPKFILQQDHQTNNQITGP
jgi:hypothetical protein